MRCGGQTHSKASVQFVCLFFGAGFCSVAQIAVEWYNLGSLQP